MREQTGYLQNISLLTTTAMFCSEAASWVVGDLKILDESPHGVSMVTLLPEAIDFSALKVIFKIF